MESHSHAIAFGSDPNRFQALVFTLQVSRIGIYKNERPLTARGLVTCRKKGGRRGSVRGIYLLNLTPNAFDCCDAFEKEDGKSGEYACALFISCSPSGVRREGGDAS